jgi:hypothetical protein
VCEGKICPEYRKKRGKLNFPDPGEISESDL